ncbi:MAG: acyl-CoA dehydrogenase family protein [Myxococcaceae bacterium]|nr:acyl-CoA dehydrogenase family protein [Myxococcaceae bacterium]
MAALVELGHTAEIPAGGSFLVTEVGAAPIVTPETFTEEQRMYYRTAAQFTKEKVLTQAEAIERKNVAVLRGLLSEAGALGLLMIDVPEAYGGLGADKTTSMLVAEASSMLGSWSVTIGAHTGIGSLPIVWFGNAEQKARYLPKLATGEKVAAYALTETGSGSDALGAKTKAVLSADGKHYVLNGAKQFITNAAFADVFVVFAKVDGEKFTGFIVDRDTPGFSVGPEEHKMGIRGSSTCAIVFEDAKVPVENVLGEIGKGHRIAFNILNLGRLKLGVGVIGGMKHTLEAALRYAADRRQFKTPILQFGLIREKLARMATAIYAVESMAYRTAGLIDARLARHDKTAADYDQKTIEAIEQYAVEASILKVFGSEALGMVVDEAVQIHGGYGFTEEFPVERAYRDARINRIFEGTNEINRMLLVGMLLKKAMKGELPLLDFAQAIDEELMHRNLPRSSGGDELAEAALTAELVKRMAVYATKVAVETFGPEIEQHQEILGAIADVVMDAFALDSMIARTRQASADGALDPLRVAMVKHFALEAQPRSHERARRALMATAEGDALTTHLKKLALLDHFVPYQPTALRETIVQAAEHQGAYPFGY